MLESYVYEVDPGGLSGESNWPDPPCEPEGKPVSETIPKDWPAKMSDLSEFLPDPSCEPKEDATNWPAVECAAFNRGAFRFFVTLGGEKANTGDSGYMVSLSNCERGFSDYPSRVDLRKYVSDHFNTLSNEESVKRYIGGWHDEKLGEFVLDVLIRVDGLAWAKHIGHANRQTHIFDLKIGRFIPI